MAIGVIRGVRRAGVRVPEDVSVIGFDNVALAEIVDPELTAVAAPLGPWESSASITSSP